MEDPNGAVQVVPSATPQEVQGATLAPSAGIDPQVSSPSAAPQEQGADIERVVRGLQGTVDQLRAQILQQQYQAQQQPVQQPQQGPQQNPYDPQTDWFNAIKWEQDRSIEHATQNALNGFQERLQGGIRQAQEMQWQQAHPQVDLNQVKMFAQVRGIQNLDDALTLLTLPQQQVTTVAQSFNAFQRPLNSAVPLRNTQAAAPTEMQGRFDQDQQAYANSQGKVYESWAPERRLAFDTEWRRREAQRNAR